MAADSSSMRCVVRWSMATWVSENDVERAVRGTVKVPKGVGMGWRKFVTV